jgi:hypothetical protein
VISDNYLNEDSFDSAQDKLHGFKKRKSCGFVGKGYNCFTVKAVEVEEFIMLLIMCTPAIFIFWVIT